GVPLSAAPRPDLWGGMNTATALAPQPAAPQAAPGPGAMAPQGGLGPQPPALQAAPVLLPPTLQSPQGLPIQPFSPTNRTLPMPHGDLIQAVAYAETMMAGAPPKPAIQSRSLVLPIVVGVMVVVLGVTAILLFGGLVGGSGHGTPPKPPAPAASH